MLTCAFSVLVTGSCVGVERFDFLGMSKVNFLACCPSVRSPYKKVWCFALFLVRGGFGRGLGVSWGSVVTK